MVNRLLKTQADLAYVDQCDSSFLYITQCWNLFPNCFLNKESYSRRHRWRRHIWHILIKRPWVPTKYSCRDLIEKFLSLLRFHLMESFTSPSTFSLVSFNSKLSTSGKAFYHIEPTSAHFWFMASICYEARLIMMLVRDVNYMVLISRLCDINIMKSNLMFLRDVNYGYN